MPRTLRLEYPGAMYHVMSRGDQRDNIFLDDVDRHDFIRTLAGACQKTGWQVHAFCLMRKIPPPGGRNLSATWNGAGWRRWMRQRWRNQAKANRIVTEELARLRWTLSVKQIAERLQLGKPKGARTNLHKFMNRSETGSPQTQLDLQ